MDLSTHAARLVPSRSADRTRVIAAVLAAFLVSLPTLAITSLHASSDPDSWHHANMTTSLYWNFTNPDDYTLSGTTVESGMVSLKYLNETTVQNTSAAFDSGTLNNLDSTTFPDSLSLSDLQAPAIRIEIQPGPGDAADTYIEEDWPNWNADGGDLRVDPEIGKEMRTLIRFNLSTLPSDAEIRDAVLWLYMEPSAADPVPFDIHPASQPFVADEATWNRWQVGRNWMIPGGDFDSESFCRGVLADVRGWHSFDISRLVELWSSGLMANNGLIIVPESAAGNAVKNFVSSDETTNTEQRPKLAVNYTQTSIQGDYESLALGPGVRCNFTFAEWSMSTVSLANDEFNASTLSTRWSWANNPSMNGGSFDIGVNRPGWLHVAVPGQMEMRDDVVNGSFLHQNITGGFDASLRIQEFFTNDSMGAGIVIMNDALSWVMASKSGLGANGTIKVTASEGGSEFPVASLPWENSTEVYLRAVKTPTGFDFYSSSDGTSWTSLGAYTPSHPYMNRVRVGPCTFSGLADETAIAEYDFTRIEPTASASGAYLMFRAGNSTLLTDPSWQSWGSPVYADSVGLGLVSRYFQYAVVMNSSRDWVSPVFGSFVCHDERHSLSGMVFTRDIAPVDFRLWVSLRTVEIAGSGGVEYSYSTDHGAS